MSRSYKRRPFMAICGNGSAKQDKIMAHRGERRANRRAIDEARKQDFEDFLPPHRLECPWNNTYSWGRDGNQNYCGLRGRDLCTWVEANHVPESIWYGDARYTCWPPAWYQEMMRK